MANEKSNYKETQMQTQVWIWAIVIFSASITWYLFIGNIFNAWAIYEAPSIGMTIFIWLLCGVFLPFLLLGTRLIYEVRDDYLYVSYFPLAKKKIFYDNISKINSEKYHPILEFGGWGIRINPAKPKKIAYSTSGNEGVRIILKDGSEIMLGTKKPKDIEKAIKEKM